MYLAHISEDKQREQPLLIHLQGTACRSGAFAKKFGCEEWCGLKSVNRLFAGTAYTVTTFAVM